MPQRTLELGDPYHCHCQKTARLLGEALGREVDVAFQSRFGRAKWLEPATDATLAAYPGKACKRVAIAAPGFSADCLETLEELGIRGRETFLARGRDRFRAARLPQRFTRKHRHARTADRARTCRLAAPRHKRVGRSNGRWNMARVAIVTGGTRGIGEAISIALKDMGMKVAANYAGNEERAREFTERTGIHAYKWDVADFDACQDGVAEGRNRAWPGRRAGQQCRHHPRHDDEADGPPEVAGGDRHQPRRLLQHGQGGVRRHDRPRLRPHRQHRLDQRPGRPVWPGQLCRRQVGHPRLHQGAGAGRRARSA